MDSIKYLKIIINDTVKIIQKIFPTYNELINNHLKGYSITDFYIAYWDYLNVYHIDIMKMNIKLFSILILKMCCKSKGIPTQKESQLFIENEEQST